jgi:hypothetical protein
VLRVCIAALGCVNALEFRRDGVDVRFSEHTRIAGPSGSNDTAGSNHVFDSMDGFAQPTGNFANRRLTAGRYRVWHGFFTGYVSERYPVRITPRPAIDSALPM